jgi:hypothetical protein
MKTLHIILVVIVVALVVRIVWENTNDSYTRDLDYRQYEASEYDRYLSFKSNIINQLKASLNLQETSLWQHNYDFKLKETSSQFEGPQVHLESFNYQIYKDKWQHFHKDSVSKYRYAEFTHFNIHSLLFDPDGKTTGKPDVRITVVPPVLFKEKRNDAMDAILAKISGDDDKVSPFRTFTKEVFSIHDSIIKIESIKMDLWLTEFNVTVEIESWRHRKDDEERLESAEINNQRLNPFEIVLKIYPNISPWYVNTGFAFDRKADMAVGSIYCKEIIKWPKETTQIGVTPKEPGASLPLIKQDYYNNLENPNMLFSDLADDRTIWNKPLYAMILFSNIGSYRSFREKGDEKISFSFIMPLLVRGSWDVQIPPTIVPKYQPAPPYRRSFFNIMVPKWGSGIFGQGLSTLLYLAIVGIVLLKLFPKIRLF